MNVILFIATEMYSVRHYQVCYLRPLRSSYVIPSTIRQTQPDGSGENRNNSYNNRFPIVLPRILTRIYHSPMAGTARYNALRPENRLLFRIPAQIFAEVNLISTVNKGAQIHCAFKIEQILVFLARGAPVPFLDKQEERSYPAGCCERQESRGKNEKQNIFLPFF